MLVAGDERVEEEGRPLRLDLEGRVAEVGDCHWIARNVNRGMNDSKTSSPASPSVNVGRIEKEHHGLLLPDVTFPHTFHDRPGL